MTTVVALAYSPVHKIGQMRKVLVQALALTGVQVNLGLIGVALELALIGVHLNVVSPKWLS